MKFLTIDTESTGTDPHEARIVQFFAGVMEDGEMKDGEPFDRLEMIVDPGIPIPEEASAVHGISNETAQAEGVDPEEALIRIRYFLFHHRDLPFVIMNARYDVPLINAEFERNGIKRLPNSQIEFLDPLVIDRGRDKYRKGKRKLENLAEHYGVEFDAELAHDAAYDCLIAGRVTEKIIEKYGKPTQAQQANWHRDWAVHFQEWLRKQDDADPDVVIGKEWPE